MGEAEKYVDGKRAVALDFDGVVHAYISPYVNAAVIPDPPTEGTREAIAELRQDYRVIIYSTRARWPGGITAIQKWLDDYEIEVDEITPIKPLACVYVDDRGITFRGCWDSIPKLIREFVPWNKEVQ